MRKAYILDSARSPIGKFLGSLYEKDASDVSKQVLSHLISSNQIDKNLFEEVIVGNVISAGLGQGFARKIAINSGVPITTPAYSLNMVCGSGMQAIINGVKNIRVSGGGREELCGGVEFMSNIPFATNTYLRLGKKFGDFTMMDLMTHDGLIDSFSGVHMGITAENIAHDLNISREEQDDYSWLSLQRAIKAVDSGVFQEEIVPIELKDYKGRSFTFDQDEFPNRTSTREKMASLSPTFLKDGTGTVTAASSSGINDGVAFVALGSEEYCKEHQINPQIEIVDYATIGCDPQKMGLGPFYAIRKLLDANKLKLTDIDILEINEAFAAQVLGCYKLLGQEYGVSLAWLEDHCNVNGSGLGLGHPLGCTGARITVTLEHYMRHHDVTYGIASLCIGGGMGAALLLRKVSD